MSESKSESPSSISPDLFVIVCPRGGIVFRIYPPYVSCWPGEGPVTITRFGSRSSAELSIKLAKADESTALTASEFAIVQVITVPWSVENENAALADIARTWRDVDFKSSELKSRAMEITGEQYQAMERLRTKVANAESEARRLRMRHRNN